MLEYVALGMMICVALILFYAIIAIHDIPYEIAKKRDHPHLEAIHYAGWVSMFTLHAIWPFLWIWATIYNKERGYGFSNTGEDLGRFSDTVARLEERIAALEAGPKNKGQKDVRAATAPAEKKTKGQKSVSAAAASTEKKERLASRSDGGGKTATK